MPSLLISTRSSWMESIVDVSLLKCRSWTMESRELEQGGGGRTSSIAPQSERTVLNQGHHLHTHLLWVLLMDCPARSRTCPAWLCHSNTAAASHLPTGCRCCPCLGGQRQWRWRGLWSCGASCQGQGKDREKHHHYHKRYSALPTESCFITRHGTHSASLMSTELNLM